MLFKQLFARHFKGIVSSLIAAAAVLLLLPLLAAAQDTGYISGTVLDKSGAAINGADVVLTNVGGTLVRNTSTNDVGAYVISALPGDTYNLSVSMKGSLVTASHRSIPPPPNSAAPSPANRLTN